MAKSNNTNVTIDSTAFNSSMIALKKNFQKQIEDAMTKSVQVIKEQSMIECKVNDSQMKSNIKTDLKISNGIYEGRISVSTSDVPYLPYVYYGTHGTWYVPEFKVYKDVSKYSWKLHGEDTDKPYYIAHGQAPNPFLEIGRDRTQAQTIDFVKLGARTALGGK